jgi:hypothetical protein
MAEPTAKLLQSLVLSAADLQALTDWDDAIIEEWLNLFRNLIQLANQIDTKNDIIKNTTHITTSPYEIAEDDEDVFFDTDAFGGPMVANLREGVDGTNYRLVNTGVTGGHRVTLNPFGTENLFGVNASEFMAMQEKLLVTFDEESGGWF